MSFIRDVSTTTASSLVAKVPVYDRPAPRGITATPYSRRTRRIADVSSVVLGFATMSAGLRPGHSKMSEVARSHALGSSETWSAPTIACNCFSMASSLPDCRGFWLVANDGPDLGKMAGGEMAHPRMLQQRRFLARADALRLEASAPECAAAGRLERVRQVAFQDDALAGVARRIGIGNGRQ